MCDQIYRILTLNILKQAFVGVVKGNVAVLEECVNKAEDEMGSLSGLKKMLSSFVGPVSSNKIPNLSFVKELWFRLCSNWFILNEIHFLFFHMDADMWVTLHLQKKPVSKSDKKAVFEPPEIFSTKDYFPQPQGSNQTEEGGSAEKWHT